MVDGNDCPYCGYGLINKNKQEDKEDDFGDKIKNILMGFMLASFVIYLVSTVALMLLSTPQAYDYTTVGRELLYLVLLIPVGITWLSGISLTVYYSLLVIAILISVGFLFYRSVDFITDVGLRRVKKSEVPSKIMDQPITRLALLFSVMVFLSFLYFILLELTGISPAVPPIDDEPFGRVVFWMTQAAVWEEIVMRFAYFGIPMAIYAYSKNKPKSWKYLFGGFGLEDGPIIPLLLFSSMIFALAHVGGWDLYKLPQVFLGGVIFGYLFAKDGLYSCIVFHFAWNYTYLYNRLSYDVSLVISILTLIWMAVGVYFTYYYTKEALTWFKKKKQDKKEEEIQREEVSLTLGKTAGFVCSNCRSYKAVYTAEGKLKCKTCGQETALSSNDSLREIKTVEVKRQWPPME